MKPEELEAFLNDYIIRQEEAKAILATKICTHFNRIKFSEITKGQWDLKAWDRLKTIFSWSVPPVLGRPT